MTTARATTDSQGRNGLNFLGVPLRVSPTDEIFGEPVEQIQWRLLSDDEVNQLSESEIDRVSIACKALAHYYSLGGATTIDIFRSDRNSLLKIKVVGSKRYIFIDRKKRYKISNLERPYTQTAIKEH